MKAVLLELLPTHQTQWQKYYQILYLIGPNYAGQAFQWLPFYLEKHVKQKPVCKWISDLEIALYCVLSTSKIPVIA